MRITKMILIVILVKLCHVSCKLNYLRLAQGHGPIAEVPQKLPQTQAVN